MPRVTITVPDKIPQPYRFQLDRRLVTLGRGSDNDIVVDCGSVSVRHAEMERMEGEYVLRDLGSTNGTKEDGERKSLIRLKHGKVVQLGDVDFDFQLSDEERDVLAREKPQSTSVNEALPPLPPSVAEVKREQPSPREMSSSEKEESGVSMVFPFLLAAGLAFFIGLALRHHGETGQWNPGNPGRDKAATSSATSITPADDDTQKKDGADKQDMPKPDKPATEPAPAPVTEPAPPTPAPPAPVTEPAPPTPAPAPGAGEPAPAGTGEPAPAPAEPAPAGGTP